MKNRQKILPVAKFHISCRVRHSAWFFAFVFVAATSACGNLISAPLSPQQEAQLEQRLVLVLEAATEHLRVADVDSLKKAEQGFYLAKELAPDDPRVSDGLGCVAWRQGNVPLAEEWFKRALEQDQSYDRAYAHLALVAESRGDRHGAEELLRIAVELNPLNYRSRNNYAAVLIDAGSKDRAQEQLLRAIEAGGGGENTLQKNLRHIQ